MKLTKQEIKFIDDYLIHNGVKFWDVRLELLDHIIASVEEKIKNQGVSFNEALLEVHHNFGNKIHNGYTYNLPFNEALFIDNKGFKKFIIKEQKEIGRKGRLRFWRTFLPFISSLRFLIEFLILVFIVFILSKYSIKHALFFLSLVIIGIELAKIGYGGFKRFSRKSLNMQMIFSSSLMIINAPYLAKMLFEWQFDGFETKPHYILFVIYFIVFAISRHSFNNFISIYKVYKERYELLIS